MNNTIQYNTRECPICGIIDNAHLFSQNFINIDGVSFLNGYEVVACTQCGFVFASNIPEQQEFDNYYINANKYEHDIEQPDIITGRYEIIINEIENLKIKKNASFIDIGCARSEILRSLQKKGYSDLTGIDPSIKNVEYLNNKGIKGIHGTIGNIDISRQYDVVCFLAVLEHIQNLAPTLTNLYNITNDNGILIVTVPDMASPMQNELPYQEFSREHINFFTEISLSNLILKHGFNIIRIQKEPGGLIGYFGKNKDNIKKNIKKDYVDIQYILNYINKSKEYEDEIYDNLLFYSNKPIIIWGLGTFTQRLLYNNILKNIIALVDSNPLYNGKYYKSIRIISPDELYKYKEPILISTSYRYLEAITNTIKSELKLTNEIIKLHPSYLFDYSN